MNTERRPAMGMYVVVAALIAVLAMWSVVQYEQARTERLEAQALLAIARTSHAQAVGLVLVAVLAVMSLTAILLVLVLGMVRLISVLVLRQREQQVLITNRQWALYQEQPGIHWVEAELYPVASRHGND